jgi:hypothetical protein
MRTLLRLAFLPALLLLPQRPAHATDIGGAYRIGLGLPLNVGSTVILCPSSDGSFSAVSCNFSGGGGGGGGGGAVTQATTPWVTADQNIANSYILGTIVSPAGSVQIGGQYEATPLNMANGTSGPLQLTATGALTVAQEDVQGVQTLSLTSTANVSVFPIANGQATMAMEAIGLTGSGATIGFYGSMDGVNYAAIGIHQNTLAYATTLNANSILFRLDVAGLKFVEVTPTVAGTGSVVLTSNISAANDRAVTLAGNSTTAAPSVTLVTSTGTAINIASAAGHLGSGASIPSADYGVPLEAFTEQTVAGSGTPGMDQYGAGYVDTEGLKPTFQSWGFITPIQGITYSFCGSTKQTRIRDLSLQGIATTAGGVPFDVRLVSTAPTGGTSAAIAVSHNQSTDTPVDASPLSYSVAPTTGTNASLIESGYIGFPLVSSPNAPTDKKWGGIDGTKSIVLTGTAQCIQIEMSSAPPAGAQLSVGLTWTEQ